MTLESFLRSEEGRVVLLEIIEKYGLVTRRDPKKTDISRQTLHSKIRYYLEGPMKKEERDTISSILLPAYEEYKKYKESVDRILIVR